MAEWVRWQLGFGRLQRLQVQTSAEPELFRIFSKTLEIFMKTTFLGVKNHEEHKSGDKKNFYYRVAHKNFYFCNFLGLIKFKIGTVFMRLEKSGKRQNYRP